MLNIVPKLKFNTPEKSINQVLTKKLKLKLSLNNYQHIMLYLHRYKPHNKFLESFLHYSYMQ